MFKAQNVFFALLIPLVSQPVFAATTTGNLPVNATVNAACIFGNITSVNFGNYTGVQNDATGTIEVNCTNGTPYTVSLGPGTGSGATTTNRLMTGVPSGTLAYALYRDAGRTQNWGNVIGTDTVAGTGSGAVQTLTAFGRIVAGLTPVSGSYNDTVLITITY